MEQKQPGTRGRVAVNLAGALVLVGLGAAGLYASRPPRWAPPTSVPSGVPVGLPSTAPSAAGHVDAPASALPSAAASVEYPPDPEWTAEDDAIQPDLGDQRAAMFRKLVKFGGVTPEQVAAMQAIVAEEPWFGQGNPKPTEHPMTRAECREIRARAPHLAGEDRERCGGRFMVPIYDPQHGETADTAPVCIDQFEFPNVPCEYPATWVRAQVAQQLCAAEGKRLCDAHEWEGACAGDVLPAETEYAWGLRLGEEMTERRIALEHDHNVRREIRWAYGTTKDHAKCATGSRKNPGCVSPTWEKCGSNTYPAGAFPDCVSPFGVYDLHGNAAEHMNLPMHPRELAKYGEPLGQTEMKGSWFIFGTYEAHIDDCRWRAPDWHGGRVLSPNSHMNYHLGFRCCKDRFPVSPYEADAGAPAPSSSAAAPAAAPRGIGATPTTSSRADDAFAPASATTPPGTGVGAGTSPRGDADAPAVPGPSAGRDVAVAPTQSAPSAGAAAGPAGSGVAPVAASVAAPVAGPTSDPASPRE